MKITVEYDTITKMGSVKQDGTDVDNLSRISFYECYCEEGEPKTYSMELTQSERNKKEGTFKSTNIYASIGKVLLDD